MSSVIFSGPRVKTLKDNISINDKAYIMAGTTDPQAVAVNAPAGSLYINTSTAEIYIKTDSGLSTNFKKIVTSD